MNNPLIIWCMLDGRVGHENQILGLIQALSQQCRVETHRLQAPTHLQGWLGRLPKEARSLPRPDLILGAGHRTHVPLLTARRRFGGRSVVIMRPSLPTWLFDLCLVPDSHKHTTGANVVQTMGPPGLMAPSKSLDASRGLILIGGPSRHHLWNDGAVLWQIASVVERQPNIHWEVTTSRRTPQAIDTHLNTFQRPNLEFVPFESTNREWLPGRVRNAGQIWVSEDSVSMLYEAITAGACVGAIGVSRKQGSRLARMVDGLAKDKWITTFSEWSETQVLKPPPRPLDESARCARLICERYQVATRNAESVDENIDSEQPGDSATSRRRVA